MLHVVSTPEIRIRSEQEIYSNWKVTEWQEYDFLNLDLSQFFIKLRLTKEIKAVLLIIPLRWAKPVDLPGLFVDDILISSIFYQDESEVMNWIDCMKINTKINSQKIMLTAMMKPFYLNWASIIDKSLKSKRYIKNEVETYLPDNYTHEELGEKLSLGANIVFYMGHGRSRGWSGYRGFRFNHVSMHEQQCPIGILISLSCSNLKCDRERELPFGLNWILSGRACSVLASCDAIELKPLETITNALLDGFNTLEISDMHHLLRFVNMKLKNIADDEILANWNTFRLIGNPFQSL